MPKRGVSRSEVDEVRAAVATYVAAGADESVQRVITAVHRVSRRLNQWYDQQLTDLEVSSGEWAVLSALARDDASGASGLTPSQLADAGHVAPSSMTHRLDRLESRHLVTREIDPSNRTRILVRLTDAGWQLYVSAIRESSVVEADLMAGLSQRQVEELADLLEKLLAGLDSADL
jgi:DNA-binding MarR family transcriptional regulator